MGSKNTKQSGSKARSSSHLSDDPDSDSQPSQERSATAETPEPDNNPAETSSKESLPESEQLDQGPILAPSKEVLPKPKKTMQGPSKTPRKKVRRNTKPKTPDVIPPPQQYTHTSFGRSVKHEDYDMKHHKGLDRSPKKVAKHEARVQEARASSASRSVKATSRKKKGHSKLSPAPMQQLGEPSNTPTNRGRNAHVSREPSVDLRSSSEDAIDSELGASDADSDSVPNSVVGSVVEEEVQRLANPEAAISPESEASDADSDSVPNSIAGSDVEEVVEQPASANGIINWISIITWALLGAFWMLLRIIWRVLRWLVFC